MSLQIADSLPQAPHRIQKNVPLKEVLNEQTIHHLAYRLSQVYPAFDSKNFANDALRSLKDYSLLQRSQHIANTLAIYLSCIDYIEAINYLKQTLTPPLTTTENNGLKVFFWMPYSHWIGEQGIIALKHTTYDAIWHASMHGVYELTRRFTSEFCIRSFIQHDHNRVLKQITLWLNDPCPHVRRLCSEGTRPRLPWASQLPLFVKNPEHTWFILEALKNDNSLYVRRSVANHIGDLAKNHLPWVLAQLEQWLTNNASTELKWLIRHALRHPAKQGNEQAIALRQQAR